MRIRRLGWAGIELEVPEGSLVIDYVSASIPFLDAHLTRDRPVPPRRTPVGALTTHLHEDHLDVPALQELLGPGGLVLRPAPFEGTEEEGVFTFPRERELAASTLDAHVVSEWETRQVGPFSVTAVPAIDGLGDPQLNWVVEAGGRRVFHGGDTLFHGFWWLIAGRLGPFDAAVLPINGAVVDVPHLQPPSGLPAAMTPAQAVAAARILGAGVLVPVHFGIAWPEAYTEDDEPLAHVRRRAQEAGVAVHALEPGQDRDMRDSPFLPGAQR